MTTTITSKRENYAIAKEWLRTLAELAIRTIRNNRTALTFMGTTMHVNQETRTNYAVRTINQETIMVLHYDYANKRWQVRK